MKVRSIFPKSDRRWLRPADVKAAVNVLHLFGDAASAGRVEAKLSLTATLPRLPAIRLRFQIAEFQNEPYHENLAPVTTER